MSDMLHRAMRLIKHSCLEEGLPLLWSDHQCQDWINLANVSLERLEMGSCTKTWSFAPPPFHLAISGSSAIPERYIMLPFHSSLSLLLCRHMVLGSDFVPFSLGLISSISALVRMDFSAPSALIPDFLVNPWWRFIEESLRRVQTPLYKEVHNFSLFHASPYSAKCSQNVSSLICMAASSLVFCHRKCHSPLVQPLEKSLPLQNLLALWPQL